MNAAEKTIKIIESVVKSVVKDLGLTNQTYHYGTIQKVHNDNSVDLYVDGASELKKYIRCNPDVKFQPTDKVIVIYINGNSKNAFVLCRR